MQHLHDCMATVAGHKYTDLLSLCIQNWRTGMKNSVELISIEYTKHDLIEILSWNEISVLLFAIKEQSKSNFDHRDQTECHISFTSLSFDVCSVLYGMTFLIETHSTYIIMHLFDFTQLIKTISSVVSGVLFYTKCCKRLEFYFQFS